MHSQVFEQLKEKTKIHHIVDFFGVGEVEAYEMLDDLFKCFDDEEEASSFLSFVSEPKDDDVPSNCGMCEQPAHACVCEY